MEFYLIYFFGYGEKQLISKFNLIDFLHDQDKAVGGAGKNEIPVPNSNYSNTSHFWDLHFREVFFRL